jgi:hypothetical protein
MGLAHLDLQWLMRLGQKNVTPTSRCFTFTLHPKALRMRYELVISPKRYRSNCCTPSTLVGLQRRSQRSYSVVAVIKIVERNLGLKMVYFSSKNIDVSQSYGQNATDQRTHQQNCCTPSILLGLHRTQTVELQRHCSYKNGSA